MPVRTREFAIATDPDMEDIDDLVAFMTLANLPRSAGKKMCHVWMESTDRAELLHRLLLRGVQQTDDTFAVGDVRELTRDKVVALMYTDEPPESGPFVVRREQEGHVLHFGVSGGWQTDVRDRSIRWAVPDSLVYEGGQVTPDPHGTIEHNGDVASALAEARRRCVGMGRAEVTVKIGPASISVWYHLNKLTSVTSAVQGEDPHVTVQPTPIPASWRPVESIEFTGRTIYDVDRVSAEAWIARRGDVLVDARGNNLVWKEDGQEFTWDHSPLNRTLVLCLEPENVPFRVTHWTESEHTYVRWSYGPVPSFYSDDSVERWEAHVSSAIGRLGHRAAHQVLEESRIGMLADADHDLQDEAEPTLLFPYLARGPGELLRFTAAWCTPSQLDKPTWSAFINRLNGRERAMVRELDVDVHPHVPAHFGLQFVPDTWTWRGNEEMRLESGDLWRQMQDQLLSLTWSGDGDVDEAPWPAGPVTEADVVHLRLVVEDGHIVGAQNAEWYIGETKHDTLEVHEERDVVLRVATYPSVTFVHIRVHADPQNGVITGFTHEPAPKLEDAETSLWTPNEFALGSFALLSGNDFRLQQSENINCRWVVRRALQEYMEREHQTTEDERAAGQIAVMSDAVGNYVAALERRDLFEDGDLRWGDQEMDVLAGQIRQLEAFEHLLMDYMSLEDMPWSAVFEHYTNMQDLLDGKLDLEILHDEPPRNGIAAVRLHAALDLYAEERRLYGGDKNVRQLLADIAFELKSIYHHAKDESQHEGIEDTVRAAIAPYESDFDPDESLEDCLGRRADLRADVRDKAFFMMHRAELKQLLQEGLTSNDTARIELGANELNLQREVEAYLDNAEEGPLVNVFKATRELRNNLQTEHDLCHGTKIRRTKQGLATLMLGQHAFSVANGKWVESTAPPAADWLGQFALGTVDSHGDLKPTIEELYGGLGSSVLYQSDFIFKTTTSVQVFRFDMLIEPSDRPVELSDFIILQRDDTDWEYEESSIVYSRHEIRKKEDGQSQVFNSITVEYDGRMVLSGPLSRTIDFPATYRGASISDGVITFDDGFWTELLDFEWTSDELLGDKEDMYKVSFEFEDYTYVVRVNESDKLELIKLFEEEFNDRGVDEAQWRPVLDQFAILVNPPYHPEADKSAREYFVHEASKMIGDELPNELFAEMFEVYDDEGLYGFVAWMVEGILPDAGEEVDVEATMGELEAGYVVDVEGMSSNLRFEFLEIDANGEAIYHTEEADGAGLHIENKTVRVDFSAIDFSFDPGEQYEMHIGISEEDGPKTLVFVVNVPGGAVDGGGEITADETGGAVNTGEITAHETGDVGVTGEITADTGASGDAVSTGGDGGDIASVTSGGVELTGDESVGAEITGGEPGGAVEGDASTTGGGTTAGTAEVTFTVDASPLTSDTVTPSLHQALADRSNLQFSGLTNLDDHEYTRMIDAGVAIVDDKLYIDWSKYASSSSSSAEESLSISLSAAGQPFNLNVVILKQTLQSLEHFGLFEMQVHGSLQSLKDHIAVNLVIDHVQVIDDSDNSISETRNPTNYQILNGTGLHDSIYDVPDNNHRVQFIYNLELGGTTKLVAHTLNLNPM